jgi:hypothetical protein
MLVLATVSSINTDEAAFSPTNRFRRSWDKGAAITASALLSAGVKGCAQISPFVERGRFGAGDLKDICDKVHKRQQPQPDLALGQSFERAVHSFPPGDLMTSRTYADV